MQRWRAVGIRRQGWREPALRELRHTAKSDASELRARGFPLCEFEELYHLEVAMWSKPAYTEMRFGFEVTMYIANR